ncbi:MAG: hypothetical protein GC191_07980 [Azospirillum sp.]|nr:hypothetical protein [Azospirillum sp.]
MTTASADRPWWRLSLEPPAEIHLRDQAGRSLGAIAGGPAQFGDLAAFLGGTRHDVERWGVDAA